MPISIHSHRRDPLLDCLGELHRWQPQGNFKSALCAAVLKVVPGSHASYSIINPARRTTRSVGTTREVPREEMRRFVAQLNDYVLQHPCVIHWLTCPQDVMTSISEAMPAREYRRGSLYNEVYHPQGIEDQLALRLTEGGASRWHTVAFSRHRRGFSARDHERLLLLRPHLIAAVARARTLARLRASEARALHQLEVLAPAAITLRPDGAARGIFFNGRAQATLAAWFGFRPLQTGDALPEALAGWLREQRRLPAGDAAGGGLATPRQPFVQTGPDGRRLVVSLLDGKEGHGDLLVLEEHRDGPPSAEPLRAALALSERQAEVLTWIAQGKGNADIGQILGISLPTVKMHVARLFEVLGCETRTAAARIALEALGRGGR